MDSPLWMAPNGLAAIKFPEARLREQGCFWLSVDLGQPLVEMHQIAAKCSKSADGAQNFIVGE